MNCRTYLRFVTLLRLAPYVIGTEKQ